MNAVSSALHADITMEELLRHFPGAQRALFRGYHLGGCSSCGFRPEETLRQVCERSGGLAVDEVVSYLEGAREADAAIEVSPAEARTLIDSGAAVLVDIRTREEYDAVHIGGSLLMTEELLQEITAWDRSKLVVFVCHHGIRSLDAAAYFAGHGMANARSLRGGIDAWSCEVDSSLPRYELA